MRASDRDERLTRGRYVDRPGNCRFNGRPKALRATATDDRVTFLILGFLSLEKRARQKRTRPSRNPPCTKCRENQPSFAPPAQRLSRQTGRLRAAASIRCHSLPQPNCQRSNRLACSPGRRRTSIVNRTALGGPLATTSRVSGGQIRPRGEQSCSHPASPEHVLRSPFSSLSKAVFSQEPKIKWETPNLALSPFFVKGLFLNPSSPETKPLP